MGICNIICQCSWEGCESCQCSTEGCETCQDACQKSCMSSCQSSCQDACETSCQCSIEGCQTCQLQCESACMSTCMISCQVGCEVSCETGCEVSCETGCEVNCENACQKSCQDSCEKDCQSTCQESCQSTCERNCQSTCQKSCQSTCQLSCQCTYEGCETCQTTCEDVCQCTYEGCESCQDTCELTCQCVAEGCESCQSTCELSCQCTYEGCESCQDTCELNAQNPPPPSSISVSNIGYTSCDISWSSVSGGNIYYKIFRDGVQVYYGVSTSGSLSGLDASTTYQVCVLSKDLDTGLESTQTCTSFTTDIYPVPSKPTSVSVTNLTPTSFKLSWGTTSNTTSYKVSVVEYVDGIDVGGVYTTNSTYYTVTNLVPDVSYHVLVWGVNEYTEGEKYGLVVTTPMARPQDWEWSYPIYSGSPVYNTEVLGEDLIVAYIITAVEWREFLTRINEFLLYTGNSTISVPSFSTDDGFYVIYVNNAIDAINLMSDSSNQISKLPQDTQEVPASVFIDMVNAIKNIP